MKYTPPNIHKTQLHTAAGVVQNLGEKVLQTPSIAFMPIDLALPPEGEPVLGYAGKSTTLKISIVMHDGKKWGYVFPDEPADLIPILNKDCLPTHWAMLQNPKYYPVSGGKAVDPITGIITDPDASFQEPDWPTPTRSLCNTTTK